MSYPAPPYFFTGSVHHLSLGSSSWIRVESIFTWVSDQTDMDSQSSTVDQLMAAMAAMQEAITSLSLRVDGQQARQVPIQEVLHFDSTPPPPPPSSQPDPHPPPSQSVLHPPPYCFAWSG